MRVCNVRLARSSIFVGKPSRLRSQHSDGISPYFTVGGRGLGIRDLDGSGHHGDFCHVDGAACRSLAVACFRSRANFASGHDMCILDMRRQDWRDPMLRASRRIVTVTVLTKFSDSVGLNRRRQV